MSTDDFAKIGHGALVQEGELLNDGSFVREAPQGMSHLCDLFLIVDIGVDDFFDGNTDHHVDRFHSQGTEVRFAVKVEVLRVLKCHAFDQELK